MTRGSIQQERCGLCIRRNSVPRIETIWRRGEQVSRSGKGRASEVEHGESGIGRDGGVTEQEVASREAQWESRMRPNEGKAKVTVSYGDQAGR